MKLNRYENKSLKEIKQWEKERHDGFHKKLLDIATKPVDFLIEKIGAKKLNVFEGVIEKTIKNLLYASSYTINAEGLKKRVQKHGIKIHDLSELETCKLELLDGLNRKHISFHKRASTIQGAVAGIGGAYLAPADLTSLLIQDFHLLQEVAYCYGFDPNGPIEKEILLRVMEAGMGSSEIKFKALKEIKALTEIKRKRKGVQVSQKGVAVLGAKALRESIEQISISFLLRFMRRVIPIVAIVTSAHSNHEIIENTSHAALMVYRKRFLERKKVL